MVWFGLHAMPFDDHIPKFGVSAGGLSAGLRIHQCKVAFALLELPNPTLAAKAFKGNFGSRRSRAARASFRGSFLRRRFKGPARQRRNDSGAWRVTPFQG